MIEAGIYRTNERFVKIQLDEYELGNLIGLMKRSSAHHNGDWFGQIVNKLQQSMFLLGLNELRNNFGDTLSREDVAEIK